jgi:hypothetical protein
VKLKFKKFKNKMNDYFYLKIDGINHSNKYISNEIRQKKIGIHAIHEAEIIRLVDENSSIKPSQILKALIHNRNHGKYPAEIELPHLTQITTKKFNHLHPQNDDSGESEYQKVVNLCSKYKYSPEIEPKKAFTFGVRLGTGADQSHLFIGLTSLALLKKVSLDREHQTVFHIDGTYKIVRNRFPLIVFGRSDVSGIKRVAVNSCTCRWFAAYAMCIHLVKACELYNHQLTGFKANLAFVYRKKKGTAKTTAVNSNMYLIENGILPGVPIPIDSQIEIPSAIDSQIEISSAIDSQIEISSARVNASASTSASASASASASTSASTRFKRDSNWY